MRLPPEALTPWLKVSLQVDFIESLVDRLPAGIRTAGKYALITKDTALFQGLQKSVQYGDFVAKAILYDDMIKRQKLDSEDALDRISEEFVNYDRLPGRWRDGLESNGLLWFYNYKIRITKVALSILRNNPVHALLASVLHLTQTLLEMLACLLKTISSRRCGTGNLDPVLAMEWDSVHRE